MIYPPLIPGKFISRYKRFLADIQLGSGEVITAHVPNTGSMATCLETNGQVWLSHHDNPKRKYAYTLEFTVVNGQWVGINTSRTNSLVEEALLGGIIKEFPIVKNLQREVRLKDSRIDFFFESGGKKVYMEVKNVTYIHESQSDTLIFPDAVTLRGRKHLQALMDLATDDVQCVNLYVLNRQDCLHFAYADKIDPLYAQVANTARLSGVLLLHYPVTFSTDTWEYKIISSSIIPVSGQRKTVG